MADSPNDGEVLDDPTSFEPEGSASGQRPVSPTPPVSVGDVFDDRYELLRAIGSGGMGWVFEGHDRRLGRTVAIKVIRPEIEMRSAAEHRFEREARAASRLNSPNVVVVHDFGQAGETLYLVMERLVGSSLSRRLKGPPLTVERAIAITLDVGRALVAAHDAKVIHRDLKPGNIFLCEDGRAKVLDFGIAKITESDTAPLAPTLTSTGMLLGTPLYMSPEAINRKREITAASDVYSLGAILFQMLAGRPPFTHDEAVVVMSMHLQNSLPRLAHVNPELVVPAGVEELMARCLAKDPDERPRAAQLVLELEDLRNALPAMALAPDTTFTPLPTPLHEEATAVRPLPAEPASSDAPPRRPSHPPLTMTPIPEEPTPGTDGTDEPSAASPRRPTESSRPRLALTPFPEDDGTPEPFEPEPVIAARAGASLSKPALIALASVAAIGGLAAIGLLAMFVRLPASEPGITALTLTSLGSALPEPPLVAEALPVAEARVDEAPVEQAQVAEPVAPGDGDAVPAVQPAPTVASPSEPGLLRIRSDAPATVVIDGEEHGGTPLEAELAPGTYDVTVSAEGGTSRHLRVTVGAGATVTRMVRLRPRTNRGEAGDPRGLPALPSEW